MGEMRDIEWLEVILPIKRKALTNKVITLDLVIENVIFNYIAMLRPTNH